MFKWIKKWMSGPAESTAASGMERNFTETLRSVTVWEVVDQFLTQNPSPTPNSVHALVEAGAAYLLEPAELLQACEKIQEHGYQYPLNPTLLAELRQAELLSFLRWHAQTVVAKDAYENEVKIRELIELFRHSQ